jgi:hypothetical protein
VAGCASTPGVTTCDACAFDSEIEGNERGSQPLFSPLENQSLSPILLFAPNVSSGSALDGYGGEVLFES